MAPSTLSCKECGTQYPLEAHYVCEHCFGPLEVAYDHSGLDPAEARRKIQAGPADIWRYADFLPLAERPRDPVQPGLTPLIRADRLAERSGSASCTSRTTRSTTRRSRSRTASSPSRCRRPSSSASRRSAAPRRATSPAASRPMPPPPGSRPTS